ncbi:hypothetical protein DFH27DRAFT_628482 [Peziza echinospora]|nr:hypothetical protein DFH27DRAFT_628482 [Peziza echinospora]
MWRACDGLASKHTIRRGNVHDTDTPHHPTAAATAAADTSTASSTHPLPTTSPRCRPSTTGTSTTSTSPPPPHTTPTAHELPPPPRPTNNPIHNTTTTTTNTNPLPTPPTTALPIPLLNPPELFSTLHPDIYRCTALDLTSRDFLKTLSLRTILTLAIEKPRPPLRHLSTALSISLIHSPIWLTTTSAASSSGEGSSSSESEPAWRQAVDEAMGYLRPEFRPVLVVDAGGIFCGVVRRVLMGWNVTATVLEYRSFFMGGGTGGRYGSEEVVEMVGGEGWEVPEGLEDLVPKKRVFGEIKEEGEREEEEEEEES